MLAIVRIALSRPHTFVVIAMLIAIMFSIAVLSALGGTINLMTLGGAEQNVPLGRAVIGGLLCAAVATLPFVPVVCRIVHEREDKRSQRPWTDPNTALAHA